MDTANQMAEAFAGEAGTAPVVNVSGVDAPTVSLGLQSDSNKATSKFYTEEDLARVRSQEKEKLYPQIDELKNKLSALEKEKEERAAQKAAQEAAEAEARAAQEKAKLEEELDVKELLKVKEREWQEQLERERQERERAFALLEREQKFAELQSYRQQILEQERDNIIPELLDLVSGNTIEEVQASIDGLKERSARIFESVQEASQATRREMVGTKATLPPAGPLETNSEQRLLTAQEIASMSMDEYAKYRPRIMSDSARGKSRGLFG
jgi:DNA repair exonuclease SbcCD ATPase subunit